MNQIRALLTTGPAVLREQTRGLGRKALISRMVRLRPELNGAQHPEQATKIAVRGLARRCQALNEEIAALEVQLSQLTLAAAPGLLARPGIGIDTAAQLLITAGDNPDRLRSEAAFARLVGVAPIPASSGRTDRHRLSRGGDRQANRVLHTIALVRLHRDPRTWAYLNKRTAQGLIQEGHPPMSQTRHCPGGLPRPSTNQSRRGRDHCRSCSDDQPDLVARSRSQGWPQATRRAPALSPASTT